MEVTFKYALACLEIELKFLKKIGYLSILNCLSLFFRFNF